MRRAVSRRRWPSDGHPNPSRPPWGLLRPRPATIAAVFPPMPAESGYFCGMVAPWPEQLPRGFDFERYEVLDCVWHGSAASVYRAQSVGLNGVVALKVFERAKADKLPDFLRLSRNARAAAAVRHPNIAAILDLGVWEERP